MAFVPTSVIKNTTPILEVGGTSIVESASEALSSIRPDAFTGEKASKFWVLSSLAVVTSGLGALYWYNKFQKNFELQTDADGYVYYFAYGTNMSLQTLEFKGVGNIRRTRRAVLKDFGLCFGYWRSSRSNPGNACVHRSRESEVHGLLMDLTVEQLRRLDRAQYSYQRIMVPIETYGEDGGQIVNAYVYTFSKEHRDALLDKPQFSPFNVPMFRQDNVCGYNYLQTMIRGAEECQLRPSYILLLRRMPSVNYLSLTHELVESIPDREYTMEEITRTCADENPLYTIRGVVFEWTGHPESLFKRYIAGKDITHFVASRFAYSNRDNIESVDTFEREQKQYVSSEVASWLAGPSNEFPVHAIATRGRPVGRCRMDRFDESWDCNPHYVHYFSYGKDMRQGLLNIKGVGKPANIRRGILRGQRMSFAAFSNKHDDPGHATVIASDDDEVHGVLYDVSVDQMRLFDEHEEVFEKIRVTIEVYPEDGGGRVIAFIFRLTPKHCENCEADPHWISHHGFTPIYREDCLPGKNQLDAIVVGAKSRRLNEDYVQHLEEFEVVPCVELTQEILRSVPEKEFSMEEVLASANDEEPLVVCRGVVFQLHTAREGIRKTFGGKDVTGYVANHWAFTEPNENDLKESDGASKNLSTLDDRQKKLVCSWLASHIMGPIDPTLPSLYTFEPLGRYLIAHYDDSWF